MTLGPTFGWAFRVYACFYYVLVVSPIAQTGRLLDFLVGVLTGSLGTVPEPDATLAQFSRRNFLRTPSGPWVY